MTLTLAIETSSSAFAVALADGDTVLADTRRPADEHGKDLAWLVSHLLETAGARPDQLGLIVADVGPGGLGSVRSGVTFANALAYSLSIPVCPVSYFEVAGAQAARQTALPVLGVVPAVAGSAYGGLYRDGAVERMRVGPLAQVAAELCRGLERVAATGRLRGRVAAHLPGTEVVDTGIERPDPACLLEVGLRAARAGAAVARVVPLNEQSSVFHAP